MPIRLSTREVSPVVASCLVPGASVTRGRQLGDDLGEVGGCRLRRLLHRGQRLGLRRGQPAGRVVAHRLLLEQGEELLALVGGDGVGARSLEQGGVRRPRR